MGNFPAINETEENIRKNAYMFAVTPYAALHEVARVNPATGTTTIRREHCRVVGIDASSEEPQFIVEVRAASGDFYLTKVDRIRKPEPAAPI